MTFEEVDEPVWFGVDTDDAFAFVSTFGITRGLTNGLDEAERAAALDTLRATLAAHEGGGGVLLAGSAWLIRGRRGNEPDQGVC